MNRSERLPLAEVLVGAPLRPVRAVMVESRGVCEHVEGEVLVFDLPWSDAEAPVCPGLLRALRPFLAAVALGIPAGQDGAYFVSCPSRKGTVWRVEETVE
ncbi:MAG TPA: hypothetical protein VNT75_04100 [Symbiobacteriaceae bacterium]|nr:hypothetical protein [Symbiobacteriaceae bacterium]